MDVIDLRGIERLLTIIGAIAFAYFGYRLYILGFEKGQSKLTTESKFYKFALSGTGPGLMFMAFGGIILVTALFTGTAIQKKSLSHIKQTGTSSAISKIDSTSLSEEELWKAARETSSFKSYEQYLDKYPDGLYVDKARSKLQEMQYEKVQSHND